MMKETTKRWLQDRRENRPTGDRTANRIHRALRQTPFGLTRTEIVNDVFKGRSNRHTLDYALSILFRTKLADFALESAVATTHAHLPRNMEERWFIKRRIQEL
jgi:hypothetical protein